MSKPHLLILHHRTWIVGHLRCHVALMDIRIASGDGGCVTAKMIAATDLMRDIAMVSEKYYGVKGGKYHGAKSDCGLRCLVAMRDIRIVAGDGFL